MDISAKDNGIGIPEADREKVFSPLHRLQGPSEHVWIGMGPANCRRIVVQHGGVIRVEADEPTGSGKHQLPGIVRLMSRDNRVLTPPTRYSRKWLASSIIGS